MAKNDNAAPTTAPKRPRKSAEEKAVAELNAAEKTRDLAKAKFEKLQEGVRPAHEALAKAEARVRFLSQNPDLPEDRRVAPAAEPEPTGINGASGLQALDGEQGV